MKYQATLQGLRIDDDEATEPILTDQPRKKKQSGFQFGDPEEYAKMTPEDQKKETDRMMGIHKRWAGQPNVFRGNQIAPKK